MKVFAKIPSMASLSVCLYTLLLCGIALQLATQEVSSHVRFANMIDWSIMPPLTALRAFAALAETGSTQSAGAALNVSHAAISQQIKALEGWFGQPLVDRSAKALVLTEQGDQLADALTLGFGAIERRVSELRDLDAERPLQITTTPTFAANWLLPRLASFRERHPDTDLMMNATPKSIALEAGGVDLAIRFGNGNWAGLKAEMLVPTRIAVVAAPALIGAKKISDPHELKAFHWLSEEGTHEASAWLRKHGVEAHEVRGMTQLAGNMMLDGARLGQGVVSTALCFVEEDIAKGRLQLLFDEPDQEANSGYYLVYRDAVQRPVAKAFAAWIRKAAQ